VNASSDSDLGLTVALTAAETRNNPKICRSRCGTSSLLDGNRDGNRSELWRTSANVGGLETCDSDTGRTVANTGELKREVLKPSDPRKPTDIAMEVERWDFSRQAVQRSGQQMAKRIAKGGEA
jgi:hypothetical protein